MTNDKGFTLIELIIVIAILGVIALIAIPNLAGIQQRSQVNADRRTAEQIGKSIRIWATDNIPAQRKIPKSLTLYDAVENGSGVPDVDGYITKGLRAKSFTGETDGGYYYIILTAPEDVVNAGKIAVGIGATGTTIAAEAASDQLPVVPATSAALLYNGGDTAGWAYLEQ